MEFIFSFLRVNRTDQSELFTQEKIIAKASDCHFRYYHLRKKIYSNMTKFFSF